MLQISCLETRSPIALNVAVMAMMIEPIFAEQRMVGIVLSALSIQVTLAGQLGTIAQLINDQMINADLLYWMPRPFCSCQFV